MSTTDPEIDVEETPETPETPEEELTPEQENARLKERVAAQDERLSTFQGVIDELRARPTERIIERERAVEREPGMSREDQEQAEARLALDLATKPGEVLTRAKIQAKREMRDELFGEIGDVAADAVIDRFLREQAEVNPILAPKIEKIFRRAVDEMGPKVKAALLTVPPDQRKELLLKEYKAAAGDYLMPLARPKVKPGVGTVSGGGAATMPDIPAADGKFRFSPSQKEAMRRQGIDDKKISDREKAIQAGLA